MNSTHTDTHASQEHEHDMLQENETIKFSEPPTQPVDSEIHPLEEKINDLQDQLLRAKAELENQRRRAQEDIQATRKFAISAFANDLLSVRDSLEMALADQSGQFDTLKMGVDMTLKQLISAFERVQLLPIDPKGEKLDPHQHQAMSAIESDQEPNTVVTVMQKGYMLADRVLRPAMVIVAKEKSE